MTSVLNILAVLPLVIALPEILRDIFEKRKYTLGTIIALVWISWATYYTCSNLPWV